MTLHLDRERILNLWAKNWTGPEIAEIIGHPKWQAISRIVCDAREAGDPRAVSRCHKRQKTRVLESLSTPEIPLHELLGIKTKTVRMLLSATTSNSSTYVNVTLPSLGRFDSPEAAA